MQQYSKVSTISVRTGKSYIYHIASPVHRRSCVQARIRVSKKRRGGEGYVSDKYGRDRITQGGHHERCLAHWKKSNYKVLKTVSRSVSRSTHGVAKSAKVAY
jgi:hypothetical protein